MMAWRARINRMGLWVGASTCSLIVLWGAISLWYGVRFTARWFEIQVWAGWVGLFRFSLARPETGVFVVRAPARLSDNEAALWFKFLRLSPRDWSFGVPIWVMLVMAGAATG